MKTKTVILAIILIAVHCILAEPVVTRKTDTTVEVATTKVTVETVNIDDLVRQLKARYEQKAKEMADRDAEIADLESKIAKAKAAGVEPTAKVSAIEAEIEAAKSISK